MVHPNLQICHYQVSEVNCFNNDRKVSANDWEVGLGLGVRSAGWWEWEVESPLTTGKTSSGESDLLCLSREELSVVAAAPTMHSALEAPAPHSAQTGHRILPMCA